MLKRKHSFIHSFIHSFTLIELLIVVAIIGILVSILLPSLRVARERAKQAVCLSNMKQISTSLSLYSLNHDNFTPPAQAYLNNGIGTNTGTSGEATWRAYANLYAKAPEIFDCPSQKAPFYSDNPLAGQIIQGENKIESGIGSNHWHSEASKKYGNGGARPYFGRGPRYHDNMVKTLEIADPSQMITNSDGHSDPGIWPDDRWCIWSPKWNKGSQPAFRLPQEVGYARHLGKEGYIFADGHAQSYRSGNIPCGYDMCWWSVNGNHIVE